MSMMILFHADHSDSSQSWNKMNPSEYFYQSLTNCIHLNFSDKRIRKMKICWLQRGNELLLILLTHLLSSRFWQINDWAFHTHNYFFEESFLKMFLMKTRFSIFAMKRKIINKFGCSWFSWWIQCPWIEAVRFIMWVRYDPASCSNLEFNSWLRFVFSKQVDIFVLVLIGFFRISD